MDAAIRRVSAGCLSENPALWFDKPVLSPSIRLRVNSAEGLTTNGENPFALRLSKSRDFPNAYWAQSLACWASGSWQAYANRPNMRGE